MRPLRLEFLEPRRLLSRSTTSLLTASPPKSTLGQAVGFADTVQSTSGIPSGNVEFLVDGKMFENVALKNGTASFSDSKLALGTQVVTAIYLPQRGTVWIPSITSVKEIVSAPVSTPIPTPSPSPSPTPSPTPTPTPTPAPGRSLQTAAVAYQDDNTSSELTWNAANINFLVSPYQEYLSAYNAAGDTSALYDNYYCEYVGGAKDLAMQQWCAANGVSYESMFLHFSETTVVDLDGVTRTLPAGSRVPTYDWDAGASLTAVGARVVMNVFNPNYVKFNAAYEQQTIGSYEQIFVDNAPGSGALSDNGGVVSGGTFQESSAATYAAAVLAFDAAEINCFAAVKAEGIKQCANIGNYAVDTALLPYVNEVFREQILDPPENDAYWYSMLANDLKVTEAAGVASIVSTVDTTTAANQIAALADYYCVAAPSDYFCVQNSNDGDIESQNFFAAENVNIGTPLGPVTVVSTGTDALGNTFDVYERKYSAGIVLYEPLPAWNDTAPLPSDTVNVSLGGSYQSVSASGSLGAAVSSASIGAGQGIVLVD